MHGESLEPGSMRLFVRLRVVRTEDGGRTTPVFDGCRPHWHSDRKPDDNDAWVRLTTAADSVEPGHEASAVLLPMAPDYWVDRVQVGDTAHGAEGSRVVAEAIVHRIDISEDDAQQWWRGDARPDI